MSASGIHNFGLFAGGGGCDPASGSWVGNMTVSFTANNEASVTYVVKEGYVMEETALYIDEERTPKIILGNTEVETVTPTDFPHKNGDISLVEDHYVVQGVPNNVHVIAHARVCASSPETGNRRELFSVTDDSGSFENLVMRTDEESLEAMHTPGLRDESDLSEDTSSDSEFNFSERLVETELGCQEGFAFRSREHSVCFTDLEFDKWGWTNGIFNSSDTAQILDIYAGAVGCDLDRATLVGSVTVEYDGDEAVVTYDTISDFWLKETHSYVGTVRLPLYNGEETVDPLKYPIIHENAVEGVVSDTFIVSGFEGDPIYVVSHATVCGYYPKHKHSLEEGTEKPIRSTNSRLRGHAKQYLYQKSWFSSVATAAVRAARKIW